MMRRVAIAAVIAFATGNAVGATRASAETEARRKLLRQFGEEAVYVIEGGRNPTKEYKYSDKYDVDNGIAKSSALADSTYLNRVLLADLLGSNEAAFMADLEKIGKTLEAGKIMQSGQGYDLSTRIPLAIPETSRDTCVGACLVALKKCTSNPAATGITDRLTRAQRQCVYDEFRLDLDRVIRDIISTKAGNRDLVLWADRPTISPYLAIALGTPVSFYSHNPKKPVGYTFDAKRGGASNRCRDTYDRGALKVVPGSPDYACSDFDIKILSPDMTYLFLQMVLPAGLLDSYLNDTPPSGKTRAQLLMEIKNGISLNQAIVDGGKRHVFKNDVTGNRGVYQKFPTLAELVKRWTDAFGREVDVKLELTLGTPSYVNLPNGPIALVDFKPDGMALADFALDLDDDYYRFLGD